MKLLTRSTRLHLLFASLTLLVAIPIFYLSIQRIVREDVDESLAVQKEELVNHLAKDSTLYLLSAYDIVRVKPVHTAADDKRDIFYTKKLYDSISREVIPYRILKSQFIVRGQPYQVQFKRSLIDGEDLIQNIVLVIVIILAFIITGMIIINRVSSKRLWSPFYKTLAYLRYFEIEKNEAISLSTTSIHEFRDLNDSIFSLVNRSQLAFQSQKTFTENASHEMQTPLAVLQGKIELLMQTVPLTQEQAMFISDLADASQRMNHLNKNLLLLTRIENHQFYGKQAVLVKPVVDRLMELYGPQLIQKNLSTQVILPEDLMILANPTLIEILLSNLISNSIRHNIIGGRIEILSPGNSTLLIQNTGCPDSLNMDKLFSRFQKESSEPDSLGLGLAICKTISLVSSFTLNYQFIGGLHSFSLVFRNDGS
jgi:signal transduction histidine kinase